MIAIDKRASLFCICINDGDKKSFYNIDTRQRGREEQAEADGTKVSQTKKFHQK
jgi:hypothetical protein